MAGAGYLLYTAGQILTAAQVNTYLMQQSAMVFATSAARDSALTSVKSEGNLTYQLDGNSFTVYSGAAWSTIGPVHGALTAWTPTITQSGTVTYTTTVGTYSRVGRRIFFEGMFVITGTGTASNVITLTLPVTAATSNTNVILGGSGYIFDNSATLAYGFTPVIATTTTLKLLHPQGAGGGALGYQGVGGGFSAALAVNDFITLQGFYEAAADA